MSDKREYSIGQRLVWIPYYSYEPSSLVTVTGLRKRGGAMLSNGWVVDDTGAAEGTERMRGGRVTDVEQ